MPFARRISRKGTYFCRMERNCLVSGLWRSNSAAPEHKKCRFNHEPINIFGGWKNLFQSFTVGHSHYNLFLATSITKHKPIQKWHNKTWLACSFRKYLVVKRTNLIDLGHLLYIHILLKVLFRLHVGPVRVLFQLVLPTAIHIRTFYLFLCQATYTTLHFLPVNLSTIF